MPAPSRGHRAQGGMTRTHSRTNSGGSSKIGLNLQFTQKDVPPPRLPDKSKKSAHFNHEPTARTGTISRIGSTHRLPSREQIAPAQLRRAPPPVAARTKDGKHRAGFTISSPSEGDDDEWVSSESGNATPNAGQSDSEAEEIKTPVEPTKPRLPPSAMQVNGFHKEDVVTPKAEVPPLPRADMTKPERPSSPTRRDYVSQGQTQPSTPQTQQLGRHDQHSHPSDSLPPPITKARSETHSPPRSRSPPPKRQSMTRPPSTHSITSRSDGASLRPHPLIRGHSYGQGAPFAAKPAPLAPLTMVSSDAAQAQLSSASSPTSLRAGSPTSIRTASPNHSSSPTSSEARRQLRRTSTSSARSTATMPAQSTSQAQASLSRSNHDRQRTLSTISSSSSFAALSSLALRSTPSPPRESIHFTSHLPPVEKLQGLEAVHPLLPPPYLNSHISILTHRNPVAESYDRIMRAKQAR